MNPKRLRRYIGRRAVVGHRVGDGVQHSGNIRAVEGDVIELGDVEVLHPARGGQPTAVGGVVVIVLGPGTTVQVV